MEFDSNNMPMYSAEELTNNITVKKLAYIIGSDDLNIALLLNNEWIGIFPLCYLPRDYHDYKVESIMPDMFEGNNPFDGLVLKVWIKGSN